MAFFGLTSYGISDYFKDVMRPDYKEPEKPATFLELLKKDKTKRPFVELIKEMDVYSGLMDGYSYRSSDRLHQQRKRGFMKPVGPLDMYRIPVTRLMEYGWCCADPAIQNEDWYKVPRYPKICSDYTKYVDTAMKIDKMF